MDLRLFVEPHQGATYDEVLAAARAAEDAGYEGFFRSDHYLVMGDGDGQPGPTDAWLTLAGLARETRRIRLGTLVTAATFRLPGVLAISVAQVDAMSGGRVELGLGTGWYAREHEAYGIAFPPLAERFDRLEEQLQVVTGLWSSDGPYSFAGRHYRLVDSPALPKPVQAPHPPVIVGGAGPRRTPRLAATYADEFNLPFQPVEQTREQFARVRAAAELTGRPLVYSVAQVMCVGRDDAEVRRRAQVLGRSVQELGEAGLVGTPAQVVDTVGRYAEAGAGRLYLQLWDLSDLDQVELVAAEVAPQLS